MAGDRVVIRRKRVKHETSFKERLLNSAREAREADEPLPPGLDRELLLRKASASETAVEIHAWISPPRAAPPPELMHGLVRKSPPHGGG